MAKTKANRSWQWQPQGQTSITTMLYFAGKPVPSCPICGATGMHVKGNNNKGFTAHCPGCNAGTAPCSTPFNAQRVYVHTRNYGK